MSAAPPPDPASVDVEKGTAKRGSLDDITMTDAEVVATDSEENRPVAEGGQVQQDEQDPNIVSWDGPDDPENPKNWPDSKKWFNIAVLSILTIIT